VKAGVASQELIPTMIPKTVVPIIGQTNTGVQETRDKENMSTGAVLMGLAITGLNGKMLRIVNLHLTVLGQIIVKMTMFGRKEPLLMDIVQEEVVLLIPPLRMSLLKIVEIQAGQIRLSIDVLVAGDSRNG